jgi:hypothetical protein
MIDMPEYIRGTKANKESADWGDLLPELVLTIDVDGHRGKVVMVIATDRDTMYRFVVRAIVELRPVEVALVVDTYKRALDHLTPAEASAAVAEADAAAGTGAGKAAFEAGDPNVTEAMSIVVYDGVHLETALLPYNAEHRVWLPAPKHDGARGMTTDVLTAAWAEGFLAHAEQTFRRKP